MDQTLPAGLEVKARMLLSLTTSTRPFIDAGHEAISLGLGLFPDRSAVAQVDAVDRVGIGGREDDLAVLNRRRGRLPLRHDRRGAKGVAFGCPKRGFDWNLHAGKLNLLMRRFAIGIRPDQAARHQIDAEDFAGVGRADEHAVAVGQVDGVHAPAQVLDHSVVLQHTCRAPGSARGSWVCRPR